ncbi:MAG: hypothetical protein C5B50_21635 [Verrucomicrobia bacterium]|nr:MAG: hypothetical protein C5B50_21635 [Verrucomicrobiota bacterium]
MEAGTDLRAGFRRRYAAPNVFQRTSGEFSLGLLAWFDSPVKKVQGPKSNVQSRERVEGE